MNAYIYKADIFCEACGKKIRKALDADGKKPEDVDDEASYDSDDYPKGPYPDGGGEADTPMHCGSGADCEESQDLELQEALPGIRDKRLDGVGLFLENPLTRDGERYVEEAAEDDPDSPIVQLWCEFYEIEIPEADEEDDGEGDDEEEVEYCRCECARDDHADDGEGACGACADGECEEFREGAPSCVCGCEKKDHEDGDGECRKCKADEGAEGETCQEYDADDNEFRR